jgi:hypothetical protein
MSLLLIGILVLTACQPSAAVAPATTTPNTTVQFNENVNTTGGNSTLGAIRAQPNPAQRSPAKGPPETRLGMRSDGDYHGGDQRDEQETALIQKRLELIDAGVGSGQRAQSKRADQVQRQAIQAALGLAGGPHKGKGAAHQQIGGPGVGAVVEPRGVDVRPVEQRYQSS